MTERNLTGFTNLAAGIVDASGFVIASSAGHAARLGLTVDRVIGRNWRDWVPPDRLERCEASFARIVAGEPMSEAFTAVRSDGSLVVSRCSTVRTTLVNGTDAVLAIHSVSHVMRTTAATLSGALDIAAYVADVAAELARMAARSGLPPLAASLQAIAGQAGDSATTLERTRGGRL